MKTISKEKLAAITGIMLSLQQPFAYVIGATLVLAQEQECFHFNTIMNEFEYINESHIKQFKCLDCGKILSLKDLKSSMI